MTIEELERLRGEFNMAIRQAYPAPESLSGNMAHTEFQLKATASFDRLEQALRRSMRETQELVALGEKLGWNGVTNSKSLAVFLEATIFDLTKGEEQRKAFILELAKEFQLNPGASKGSQLLDRIGSKVQALRQRLAKLARDCANLRTQAFSRKEIQQIRDILRKYAVVYSTVSEPSGTANLVTLSILAEACDAKLRMQDTAATEDRFGLVSRRKVETEDDEEDEDEE